MFLNLTTLSKLPITSSASRNTTRFVNIFCLQKLMKPLSLRVAWKAGRLNGKIIFKTRASLLRKYKTPKINYNLHYIQLNFVASFHFISSLNKLISLIHFANGSSTYYITTEIHSIFTYYYLNTKKTLRNLITTAYWSPIYLLKKLIFISFIELTPNKNAQYSLSSGTQSRLLVIDKLALTGLIQLPSKVKKTISYYSYVLLGRISLQEKKKYVNTRAGYWRGIGKKPIVRGVAMNPVDHPHGGRTKSVRYPRTPWGKTTKFK